MTEKKEIREQIVLIVEDNLSNYEIAKTFLNDMNICCESATDGIEALDMYDTRGKGYYSAILMDINLPRLNGLQTAARLRIRDDCIPVIAMTAYRSDTHFMNDAYDLFDSVISKPFDFATFSRRTLTTAATGKTRRKGTSSTRISAMWTEAYPIWEAMRICSSSTSIISNRTMWISP